MKSKRDLFVLGYASGYVVSSIDHLFVGHLSHGICLFELLRIPIPKPYRLELRFNLDKIGLYFMQMLC